MVPQNTLILVNLHLIREYKAPPYLKVTTLNFRSGEYGMGTMANELSLGCDCLGQIHYLPGAYIANDGSAMIIKNVICIHEEDAGVLWKHTDYRPNGRSQTVRRRRLVVSMVCTLANYGTIFSLRIMQRFCSLIQSIRIHLELYVLPRRNHRI